MSLDLVAVPGWLQIPWLVHGFTTRTGGRSTIYGEQPRDAAQGELNLGLTAEDDGGLVRENRARLLDGLRMPSAGLLTLRQTHSSTLYREDEVTGAPALREGDGLLSDRAGVLLGILTADCVPVLVVDPVRRAVGAFHAGWRGTVQGIAEKGVARMVQEFGSRPGELLAAIGPSIGPCCYGVGDELRDQFAGRFPYAGDLFSPRAGGWQLDLWEANRRQLLHAGLAEAGVWSMRTCTACHVDRFFSHRKEQGNTGRMLAIAGIRTQ